MIEVTVLQFAPLLSLQVEGLPVTNLHPVFASIHESSAVFSPHPETDELTIQLNNSVSDILFSKSKRIKYSQYLNFHYF